MKLQKTKYLGKIKSQKFEFFVPEFIFSNGIPTMIEAPIDTNYYYNKYEIYKYDNDKIIYEEKKHPQSKFLSITKYEYNSFGDLIEINKPESENPNLFWEHFNFKYDERKLLIEKTKLFYNRQDWKNNYYYDEFGFLIKESWRSDKYALIDFNYKNDQLGNQIYKEGKYLLGPIETFCIVSKEFNKRNLCVKEVSNETGTKIYHYDEFDNLALIENENKEILEKFTYDKFQNLIEYIQFFGQEHYFKENYIYEYDNEGNWTKLILNENEKPKVIIKRIITYNYD